MQKYKQDRTRITTNSNVSWPGIFYIWNPIYLVYNNHLVSLSHFRYHNVHWPFIMTLGGPWLEYNEAHYVIKFAKYCRMRIMNQDDWITNINTKRRKTWFCLPSVNMQTNVEAIVPVNVLCKREKPFM